MTFYFLLRHVCFELKAPTCGGGVSPLLMRPTNGPRSRCFPPILASDASRGSYLFSSHSLSGWVSDVQRNPVGSAGAAASACLLRITQLNFSVASSAGAGSVALHCACARAGSRPEETAFTA